MLSENMEIMFLFSFFEQQNVMIYEVKTSHEIKISIIIYL